MTPALALLLSLAAGPVPRVVLADEAGCVEEAALAAQLDALLADDEALTRLALRVEVAADGDARELRIDLFPHELRPPVLHRELSLTAADCPSTPAAIAHIVARGLEGLPRTRWVRPVPASAPLTSSAVISQPSPRVAPPPPSAPESYATPRWRLRMDGAVGVAGPDSLQAVGSLSVAAGPAPWPRALVSLDLGASTWPHPLGDGAVEVVSSTLGVGVEAGTFPLWRAVSLTPQLVLTAGAVTGFGFGFADNLVRPLPAAGLSARALLRSSDAFLRFEVDGAFVRQRFVAVGAAAHHAEPPGRVGLLIGASFSWPARIR
jgi:hypothetical protein